MSINLQGLGGLIVLLATTTFPVVAVAQTETAGYESTNNVFDRAYFRYDRTYYENSSLKRQIDAFFGPGATFGTTFPDNEIAKDGELVNTLYHDVLFQQAQNDPYLRTPDLPNPYNSSLLMSPQHNANKLKVGTEYRFESFTSR
ncbi:MAG: hypothetical protein RLZZ507_1650 [Cyanobacteriota bacterium]|jgi:hypothetical protein